MSNSRPAHRAVPAGDPMSWHDQRDVPLGARRGYAEPPSFDDQQLTAMTPASAGMPDFQAPMPRRAMPEHAIASPPSAPQPAPATTGTNRAQWILLAFVIGLILLAVVAAIVLGKVVKGGSEGVNLGDDYQVSVPEENLLDPSYHKGATLRQLPSPKIVGFDAAAGIYVLDTGASFTGFELESGKQVWHIDRVNCSEAVGGNIYCSTARQAGEIQKADLRTGELQESYPKPDNGFFGIQNLGVRDGVEYLLFRGSPNVLAAGKAGSWLWTQPLPTDGIARCALLADHVGCANSASLVVLDAASGAEKLSLAGDFSLITWLGDGFLSYNSDDKQMHAFDLAGKDLGPGRVTVTQPKGLFSLADVNRDEAAVLDSSGRIVVKRIDGGQNYELSSGELVLGHHLWVATTHDGKLLAAAKDGSLKIMTAQTEMIDSFDDVTVPTVRHRLITVKQGDDYFLLVPKK